MKRNHSTMRCSCCRYSPLGHFLCPIQNRIYWSSPTPCSPKITCPNHPVKTTITDPFNNNFIFQLGLSRQRTTTNIISTTTYLYTRPDDYDDMIVAWDKNWQFVWIEYIRLGSARLASLSLCVVHGKPINCRSRIWLASVIILPWPWQEIPPASRSEWRSETSDSEANSVWETAIKD